MVSLCFCWLLVLHVPTAYLHTGATGVCSMSCSTVLHGVVSSGFLLDRIVQYATKFHFMLCHAIAYHTLVCSIPL